MKGNYLKKASFSLVSLRLIFSIKVQATIKGLSKKGEVNK